MGADCSKNNSTIEEEKDDYFNPELMVVPKAPERKTSMEAAKKNHRSVLVRVGSRIISSGTGRGTRKASNYNHVHEAVMLNLSEQDQRVGRKGVVHGVVGLRNLGNTCFLNSSIQCLSNTIPLTDYFLGYDYRSEINRDNFLGTGGKLVTAYADLIKTIWFHQPSNGSSSLSPSSFKSNLESFAPQFSGNYQHDAQEFLSFLLDGIHEDLNRVKKRPYIEDKDCDGTNDEKDAMEAWSNYLRRNKSLIVDLFQGQLKNTCQCKECGFKNIRFEAFMYLSLPVDDSSKTLEDCLDDYLKTEDLVGDDQWYCSKCKKHVDATKKIDLWVLPPILIIHLKRFRFSSRGRKLKTSTQLRYPLESSWDLSSVVKSNGVEDPWYDLYAVANHWGNGVGSGHYTAYALNRLNDEWYEFNDSIARLIDPIDKIQNSDAPYLLFYNRCSPNDIRDEHAPSTASGPLIRRQSVSRPDQWPHMQVTDDNFREFSRPSSKNLDYNSSMDISNSDLDLKPMVLSPANGSGTKQEGKEKDGEDARPSAPTIANRRVTRSQTKATTRVASAKPTVGQIREKKPVPSSKGNVNKTQSTLTGKNPPSLSSASASSSSKKKRPQRSSSRRSNKQGGKRTVQQTMQRPTIAKLPPPKKSKPKQPPTATA